MYIRTKAIAMFTIVLILVAGCGQAEPTDLPESTESTWVKKFEGTEYGAFFDITLTEDGNVFTVGTTNHRHVAPYEGDALFMKLTLDGDVIWERTWGGEGYEQAWSVTPANDGGFYVFGETDSYGTGDRDFFLLKLTEDGSEEWFQTYGRERREWPYGMLQLANGDLLIYGFSEDVNNRERNQYALRIRPNGDVIWDYIVESRVEELVVDAIETIEGDIVLATIIGEDGQLVKLDRNGNVLWTQRYELPGWQFASQVIQTEDGGFLLAGFSMSKGSHQQADTWLAHCTSAGELDWETSFGDPTIDDYGQSLIQLKDGTYLIGGLGRGMPLSKINVDGEVVWTKYLFEDFVYGAETLIELDDGSFLIAGFIQKSNGRLYDAIILRTNSEGQVME